MQTELTSIIGDRTAHQILTERPRRLTSQTPDLPPQKRLWTGKQPAADSRADTSQSVNYPVRSLSTPTAIDNAAAPATSTSTLATHNITAPAAGVSTRADTFQSVNYPARSFSTHSAIDNAAAPAASTSTTATHNVMAPATGVSTTLFETLLRQNQTLIDQLLTRTDARPADAQNASTELTGEQESLIRSTQSLFPGVNGRYITAILKGSFDLVHLAKLQRCDSALDTETTPVNYSLEDGRFTAREDRSLRDFKTFRDWSGGFLLFSSIFTELFQLPLIAAAIGCFHFNIMQAADIYNFKTGVLLIAIKWHN